MGSRNAEGQQFPTLRCSAPALIIALGYHSHAPKPAINAERKINDSTDAAHFSPAGKETPAEAVFRAILREDIDWKPFAAFPAVFVLLGNTLHFPWAKCGDYITQVTAIGPLGLKFEGRAARLTTQPHATYL